MTEPIIVSEEKCLTCLYGCTGECEMYNEWGKPADGENCYYICAFYRLDFDYVQFIKDKDVYHARLTAFAKKANEEKEEEGV